MNKKNFPFFLLIFLLIFYLIRLINRYNYYVDGQHITIITPIYKSPKINNNIVINNIVIDNNIISSLQNGCNEYIQISGSIKKTLISFYEVKYSLINPNLNKINADLITDKNLIKYKLYKLNNCFIPFIDQKINNFRSLQINKLRTLFAKNVAGLIVGMSIGSKSAISIEFKKSLIESGLIHLAVASGTNIIIISSIIFSVISNRLNKKFTIILSLIFIATYSILIGLDPPIVRAFLMMSLLWFSKLIGRKTSNVFVLVIIGFVMLINDPYLVNDISFQLSFLATLGIIVFSKRIISFINSNVKFNIDFVKEDIAQTLSAQIMVVPIILMTFQKVNLLSIVANVLVAPLIVFITVSGWVVLLISYFSIDLSQYIAWMVEPVANIVVLISYLFSNKLSLSLNYKMPVIMVLGYYLLIIWKIYADKYEK